MDELPPVTPDVRTVVFMGWRLRVEPGTLAPRPETELLARTALGVLAAGVEAPSVVDMCCGAGNLAVAIAGAVPRARVWASDVSAACVSTTRHNVAAHGLQERVAVSQGDLFAPLVGRALERSVDLVVCNPPYISSGRLTTDRAHLLEHEPREAFDGGPYGLGVHQRVLRAALDFLKPGGALVFEFGQGQGRQVRHLFDRTRGYQAVQLVADAEGHARVAVGRARAPG